MPNDEQNRQTGGRTPVPDPTLLTTQALLREVTGLREYLESRIESMEDVQNEKHIQAEQQFALVERQRVEQKKDTKDAVDAALAAAKEAVKEQTTASERATTKSETAINKLVEQQALTFKADNAALIRQMDELKDRIVDVDRKVEGVTQQKIGAKDDRSALYAIVGFIGTVVVVGIAIVGFIAARGGP